MSARHLDALRIIAAGAVVALHYSDYARSQPIGNFLLIHTQHFNLFVDLFFVISGYVIASQYLDSVDSARSVGHFVWRRLARIYPLHVATLLFYVVLALAIHFGMVRSDNPDRYPFTDLPAQLVLLHSLWGERLTFNFPSWSLSAEMFCYLAFPAIAALCLRRKEFALLLVVLPVAANCLWVLAARSEPWAEWINQGGAFRALPAFDLGVASYLFRDWISRWRIHPFALPASLIVFLALGSYLSVSVGLLAVYAIALLAIHFDCAGHSTPLTKLGLHRWSHLTYSCYMLHVPVATVVLTFGARHLPSWIPGGRLTLIPIAVLALMAASVLSYRFFETPLRQHLNRAFGRSGAGHPAVPPAAPTPALPVQEATH
ncbi:hypothetical protein DB459_16610 [Bradyrhizobium sp. WD16]|nr:hypothetical protein DB459_16610 [Bradyrhizobium sp. WD16]